MFQPTTECIDSLAIDDIANQNANLNTAVGWHVYTLTV